MSDESPLRDLLTVLGEEMRGSVEALTNGLAGLSRSPEVVILRRTLEAAATASGVLSPREAAAAIDRLQSLADQLRREGIDPALGLASLVGDCLDGLDVLVATDVVPLPVELEELRLLLIRMRRPEVRLDLALPAIGGRARLAGKAVRLLVEDAEGVAESGAALTDLEAAVSEAVAGAIARTRRYDPAQPVEVRARLRADLLAVEIADHGVPRAASSERTGGVARASEGEWDSALARRVMDRIAYEATDRGGILRLTKRLRSWQLRWRGS